MHIKNMTIKILRLYILIGLFILAGEYVYADAPSPALKDQSSIVSLKDQGAGIADSEKEKVFTKFYRIGSEEKW